MRLFAVQRNADDLKNVSTTSTISTEHKLNSKSRQRGWRHNLKVEVLSPMVLEYFHPKNPKSTLNFARVEVVEMSEIFSDYLA
jgi:hypothetical protein